VGGRSRARDADAAHPADRRSPAGVPDRDSPPGELPRLAVQGHRYRRHHLLFSARLLAAETFQYFAIFTTVLVIYFAISYPASRGVVWLERRMRIGA